MGLSPTQHLLRLRVVALSISINIVIVLLRYCFVVVVSLLMLLFLRRCLVIGVVDAFLTRYCCCISIPLLRVYNYKSGSPPHITGSMVKGISSLVDT